jgi:hypothetical protein
MSAAFKIYVINKFMQTYIQMFSTINKNGKTYLGNVYDWAEMTLTDERLLQFQTDRETINSFFADYINSGELSIEVLYSSAMTNDLEKKIPIGLRHIWQNTRVYNTTLEQWESEFANDPSVNYRAATLDS